MRPFERALERLVRSSLDMAPVMRDIASLLEREADDNFRAQDSPPWKSLSPGTILTSVSDICYLETPSRVLSKKFCWTCLDMP